jgi:hypothetical protein
MHGVGLSTTGNTICKNSSCRANNHQQRDHVCDLLTIHEL